MIDIDSQSWEMHEELFDVVTMTDFSIVYDQLRQIDPDLIDSLMNYQRMLVEECHWSVDEAADYIRLVTADIYWNNGEYEISPDILGV